jgi:hypothetical protein
MQGLLFNKVQIFNTGEPIPEEDQHMLFKNSVP